MITVFVQAFHFYLLNMQNYHSVDTELFSLHHAASAAMDLCILRHRTQFELRTECWSSCKVGTTAQAGTHCLRMSFNNLQTRVYGHFKPESGREKHKGTKLLQQGWP